MEPARWAASRACIPSASPGSTSATSRCSAATASPTRCPGAGIERWPIPVHQCALVAMGVHLLDNLMLGRLLEACARERRWEFLFTVAPLRVDRGTGSPVNPIAVF